MRAGQPGSCLPRRRPSRPGGSDLSPKHVFFSRGHRPGGNLLRCPVLERTIHVAGFQGQTNVIAGMQLGQGLPVVPILCLSRRPERADQREGEDRT